MDDTKHRQKQASGSKDTIEEAKMLKSIVQQLEIEHVAIVKELHEKMRELPNFVHESVVVWASEDENVETKRIGSPRSFSFVPVDHQTLGENLGILDKNQAAKVSGARFFYLIGAGAQLQYALMNYVFSLVTDKQFLADLIERQWLHCSPKPFQIVVPPTIISYETMDRMGRLHPMDDRYCLEVDKQVLVGSAEHSLGPIHMDQTLLEDDLPRRYIAFTSAYRREAWSYGKDAKGILRTHEFHKMEMETFSIPENGMDEQKLILAIQEYITHSLGLPYRLLNKCTADVGWMNYTWYDVEVWFPSQNTYRETHTADYMTDYQARRLGIKVAKNDGTKVYAHMNDATAAAMGRMIAAILENYQHENGTVDIPEVLQPFLGGKKLLTPFWLE
jgi:seryl-tRNA synthetase